MVSKQHFKNLTHLFRQFSIHLTVLLSDLCFVILSMRMLREMVLKALLKSRSTASAALASHPPSPSNFISAWLSVICLKEIQSHSGLVLGLRKA